MIWVSLVLGEGLPNVGALSKQKVKVSATSTPPGNEPRTISHTHLAGSDVLLAIGDRGSNLGL